jgi:hypothetical protein
MKIYTGLNENGRASMREFLIANLKDETLAERQIHFEADIDFDRNPGAYELEGRLTKTGNPATTLFSDDEMISEKISE